MTYEGINIGGNHQRITRAGGGGYKWNWQVKYPKRRLKEGARIPRRDKSGHEKITDRFGDPREFLQL